MPPLARGSPARYGVAAKRGTLWQSARNNQVRLAASYGELSESLQQRVELVMKFFLALGEGVGAPAEEEPQTKAPSVVPKTPESGADVDANIFGMGRG